MDMIKFTSIGIFWFISKCTYDSGILLYLYFAILGFIGYKIGSGIGNNFGSYTIIKWHPNLKKHINQGWQLSQPTA